MATDIPNSQKAVQTRGSAPLKSCLILCRNMAQEHAADPGRGSGSGMWLAGRDVALFLQVIVMAWLPEVLNILEIGCPKHGRAPCAASENS
jgi:hypothetical protein